MGLRQRHPAVRREGQLAVRKFTQPASKRCSASGRSTTRRFYAARRSWSLNHAHSVVRQGRATKTKQACLPCKRSASSRYALSRSNVDQIGFASIPGIDGRDWEASGRA
jgi:hypothetical protein